VARALHATPAAKAPKSKPKVKAASVMKAVDAVTDALNPSDETLPAHAALSVETVNRVVTAHTSDNLGDLEDADHDEHHLEHLQAMNALKEVLQSLDAAVAGSGGEGNQTQVMMHLNNAALKLMFALSTEGGGDGHGSDGAHSEDVDVVHEHTAEKLTHARHHLEEAVREMAEHSDEETEEEHVKHTAHALKCLATVKHIVHAALADGMRACAMGETEHALRDLLMALVEVTGATPKLAVPKIQHAIQDLSHTSKDLEILIKMAETPHHQDEHSLHGVTHALEILTETVGELSSGEWVKTRESTHHVIKHIGHAMKDIKGANTDLHIAHSLADLFCAMHDIEHIKEDEEDAEHASYVAGMIESDMKHAIKVAVYFDHLTKPSAVKVVIAANALKASPLDEEVGKKAKKEIMTAIMGIKARCAQIHRRLTFLGCRAGCKEGMKECLSGSGCETLEIFAGNADKCFREAAKCGRKIGVCRKCCTPKNAKKDSCKEFQTEHHSAALLEKPVDELEEPDDELDDELDEPDDHSN
jgi:hypothetical protein